MDNVNGVSVDRKQKHVVLYAKLYTIKLQITTLNKILKSLHDQITGNCKEVENKKGVLSCAPPPPPLSVFLSEINSFNEIEKEIEQAVDMVKTIREMIL